MRLFTWTAVLYASLAMPLLQRMLPPLPVSNARVSQAIFQSGRCARLSPVHFGNPHRFATCMHARQLTRNDAASIIHRSCESKRPSSRDPPRTAPQGIRFVVISDYGPDSSPPSLIVFVHRFRGHRRRRQFISHAWLLLAALRLCRARLRPAAGARIARDSRSARNFRDLLLARRPTGLPSVPRVAESELISVPVTMGVLRPTILLPYRLAGMGRCQARRRRRARSVACRAARCAHPASFPSASRNFLVQPARLVARPASRRPRGAG